MKGIMIVATAVLMTRRTDADAEGVGLATHVMIVKNKEEIGGCTI